MMTNKQTWILVLGLATLGAGCGDDVFGTGGTGGSAQIGPIEYVPFDQVEVADDCDSFQPGEPSGEFQITIDGNTLDLLYFPDPSDASIFVAASTDTFFPDDEAVTLFGGTSLDANATCTVEFVDQFTVTLTDPDLSLEDNDTLDVTWDTQERTDTPAACDGVWPNDLPCEAEVTFQLTRVSAPEI